MGILRLFPALACTATVRIMPLIARALGGTHFSAALASALILCVCVSWQKRFTPCAM